MIKLVIFDIDGTLIPMETHCLDFKTKEAILKLKEKEIIVVLSTGRQFTTIQSELKDIGFDYYVCGNGACITDSKGSSIIQHNFNKETVNNLIKDFTEMHLPLVFRYEKGALDANPDVSLKKYSDGFFHPKQSKPNNLVIELGNKELPYAALTHLEDEHLNILKKKYPLLRFVVTAGGLLCDVTKQGVHKGTGLIDLCNMIGIKAKDTIAFGNDSNDIELLNYAGLGIAMGDGVDQLKKEADYITTSCKEYGVVNALSFFDLI